MELRRWEVLNVLVERELHQPHPTEMESLFIATVHSGVFRRIRFNRLLEWLVQWRYVIRQGTVLRPTVAGIAAARPWSSPR